MNPFVKSLLMSVARYTLTALATWLVTHGVIQAEQADSFVTPEVLIGVVTGLSVMAAMVRAKFVERQEKLTGMAMPKGTTEAEVKEAVRQGVAPSVTTPPDSKPVLTRVEQWTQ